MSEEIIKRTRIEFEVGLDENHVPLEMKWKADDGGGNGSCKAVMIALWDEKEENTMRIDLWNKEMNIYDMQKFFHQSFLTMGDTYSRATGDDEAAREIRKFASEFARKVGLIS
jgi:gliding motility-associated protein GldC